MRLYQGEEEEEKEEVEEDKVQSTLSCKMDIYIEMHATSESCNARRMW